MKVRPDPRMGFRALVVRQPYAAEIASGEKPVEYRDWITHYRGDLLITAAARREPGHPGPYACAVCVVRLDDVVQTREGPEWLLSDPRPVEPVPVSGKLKLWPVSDELMRALGLELG